MKSQDNVAKKMLQKFVAKENRIALAFLFEPRPNDPDRIESFWHVGLFFFDIPSHQEVHRLKVTIEEIVGAVVDLFVMNGAPRQHVFHVLRTGEKLYICDEDFYTARWVGYSQ